MKKQILTLPKQLIKMLYFLLPKPGYHKTVNKRCIGMSLLMAPYVIILSVFLNHDQGSLEKLYMIRKTYDENGFFDNDTVSIDTTNRLSHDFKLCLMK